MSSGGRVLRSGLLGLVAWSAILLIGGEAGAQESPVEVIVLDSGAALEAQGISVLENVLFSEMSQLPNDRFTITRAPSFLEPGCAGACIALAAGTRGAKFMVIGSFSRFGDKYLAMIELFDAVSGQLLKSETTEAVDDPTILVVGITAVSARIREAIDPPRYAQTHPSPEQDTVQPSPAEGNAQGPVSTLKVVTDPPGAQIFIQREGNIKQIGLSPIEKVLLPVEYRVIARLEDHRTAKQEVLLEPSEVETLFLEMKRVYPMSPHKKLGHVFFWPGLAVTAFGFVSMKMAQNAAADYENSLADSDLANVRSWTGGMWASFGLGIASMTTGVVLWAATPSSKEHWENSHAAGLAPLAGGGAAATYRRCF